MILPNRRTNSLAAAMLLIHAFLLGWSATRQSPTRLEPDHLVAGLSHVLLGRFDLFRVNPPLVRTVASIPVAATTPKVAWQHYDPSPFLRAERDVSRAFFRANGSRALRLITLARWACIPFSLFGAYFCFRWACQLYGNAAGLTAEALWCFCPYVLGHATLITSDAQAAAVALVAGYAFWLWLSKPNWNRVLVAGLTLGLAELCKYSLLVLYPLWIALWLLRRLSERRRVSGRQWQREAIQLSTAIALSILAINIGYGFEGSLQRLGSFRFQSQMLTGVQSLEEVPPEGANRFAGTWVGKLPVPLPLNMVQGIDRQRYDFERGFPSYLRGRWQKHGWWYYYLYALAIKIPLGTWCLVTLAAGVTIFGRDDSTSWRDELVVLAPFVVILILVSSQTGFSIHSRYAIPALPFLFVWTSKVARALEARPCPRSPSSWGRGAIRWLRNRRRPVVAALFISSLIWSIGSSLAVYPHSLSYFNELAAVLPTPAETSYPKRADETAGNNGVLSSFARALSAGPRNGPRHLLNSNIDWGQNYMQLRDWLDSHPDVKLDGLAYYGSPAMTAIIPAISPPPIGVPRNKQRGDFDRSDARHGPKPGWYALSLKYIYSRDRNFRYFLGVEPVAMAGYSIHVYHITLEDANRMRRELGLAELSGDWEQGSVTSRLQER